MLGNEQAIQCAASKGARPLVLSPDSIFRVTALVVGCTDNRHDAMLFFRDDQLRQLSQTVKAASTEQDFADMVETTIAVISSNRHWRHSNMISGGTAKISDLDRLPSVYKMLCPAVQGRRGVSKYLVHSRRVFQGAHKYLIPFDGFRFVEFGPTDLVAILVA